MKYWLIITFLFCFIATAFTQSFSNKGREFWAAYGYHCQMGVTSGNGANSQEMVFYFTSDKNATVTIEIPGVGYTEQVAVIANQVSSSKTMPKSGSIDSRISDTGFYKRGIRITSTEDIVAYAHIYNGSISGATLLFPTSTLGKEYFAISYEQKTNQNFSNSFAFVVAVEDNTQVEITPSVTNKNNRAAGVPFTVNLNKGEVYNVMGTTSATIGTDLTATRIRTISGTGGNCKRIAVFSGCGKISIGGNQTGSADNLFAQSLPATAWGLKYLTAPTGTLQRANYYRICVTDPTTIVKLNGVVIANSFLQRNFFYELKNNTPLITPGNGLSVPNIAIGVFNLIEADKPITVAQYTTTQGQDGNGAPGDPEMIYLSPIEQTISSITLNSTQNFNITQHGINVIIPKNGVNSFKLDGAARVSDFFPHPQDANFSYAIFQVQTGNHTLVSDSGFNSIAYGFGQAESYGYNAGTNVKDLSAATISTQYGTSQRAIATICVNNDFSLSVPLSFKPTSITWKFATNPSNPQISPNTQIGPITNITHPQPVNGLYSYSPLDNNNNPIKFNYSVVGKDTISLITSNPTPDGCNVADQIIQIPIEILPKPKANFVVSSNRCNTSTTFFTDASTNLNGSPIIDGFWDFDDGSPVLRQNNPSKILTTAKTYNIKYTPINDIGCLGDTVTLQVDVSSSPIANFGFSDTTCVNKVINFTDSSTIATGSIAKWMWDYGDGNGFKDTLATNALRSFTYNSFGAKLVTLKLESSTGCQSNPLTKTVWAGSYPIVGFKTPAVVCLPSGLANFTDTTTFPDNVPIAKYAWNFGDGGLDTISKNPTYKFNALGPYDVLLQVATTYGCVASSKIVFNNIMPQPKATIGVNAESCLRDTTFFSDISTVANDNIVSWNWVFDENNANSTLQNPNRVYNAIGVKNVSLWYTTQKGCVSDTAFKTVTINPLPIANFTATAAFFCETRPVDFLSTSTSSVGNIKRWHWNLADGRIVDTANGNTFPHSYAKWGTNNVKLMVENEKGCKSDTIAKQVTTNPLPNVGFAVPEICLADAAAQFTDTSTIADGTAAQFLYSWNINAGPSPISPIPTNVNGLNTKSPSAKYNKSAIYTISSTVTSNNGCAVTLEKPFTVNGSIPVAKFVVQAANNLCANDSVYIRDISTVEFGSITKIEAYWDNLGTPTLLYTDQNPTSGDGISGKIYSNRYANFTLPTASKNYEIRFKAFSGGVCINETKQTILVNPAPKVAFSHTLASICSDTTARLINQANEITSIAGTGAYSGNGINASGIFSPRSVLAGTYPIQYKFTSTVGCADSITQPITVWPSPIAKWGVSSLICEKNAITFSDTSVANFSNIVEWRWNYGDGNTAQRTNGNAYNFTYLNASNTPYNVGLQVITDSGCFSKYEIKPIKVNFLPLVNFTMPSICLPDGNGQFVSASTIPDNSQGLFSYLWNFDDPNDATPSTLQAPNKKYTALAPTNGYQVKLIITTKDACIDSLTQSFTTVYPQPKTDFDAIPNQVCIRDIIQFNDKTNGITSTPQRWFWNLDQGFNSNLQNPSRSFNDSGTFNISLYSFNAQNCVSDTITKQVIVHPYPGVELGNNIYLLEGGTIPIKPISYYGNQLSFLWTPSSYLSSDTVVIPFCTPPDPSPFDSIQYKLTLTGIGGCAVTDDIYVVVLKQPKVPNAFSPNGDGINDRWVIKYIESYPNASVEVYNRYGQSVFALNGGYKNSNGWDGTYNGNPLPIGTYYYVINPRNGRQTINGSVTIIR